MLLETQVIWRIQKGDPIYRSFIYNFRHQKDISVHSPDDEDLPLTIPDESTLIIFPHAESSDATKIVLCREVMALYFVGQRCNTIPNRTVNFDRFFLPRNGQLLLTPKQYAHLNEHLQTSFLDTIKLEDRELEARSYVSDWVRDQRLPAIWFNNTFPSCELAEYVRIISYHVDRALVTGTFPLSSTIKSLVDARLLCKTGSGPNAP